MKLSDTWEIVKEAGQKFLDDKGPRLGAALAFYTAVALSPLLLVVVAIAGFAFGEEAARGEIVEQIRGVVGGEAAVMIEQLVPPPPARGWRRFSRSRCSSSVLPACSSNSRAHSTPSGGCRGGSRRAGSGP